MDAQVFAVTMVVSQAHTEPQTHRVVHSENVQLFTCQSHDSDVVSTNKVKVAGYHVERKKRRKKGKQSREKSMAAGSQSPAAGILCSAMTMPLTSLNHGLHLSHSKNNPPSKLDSGVSGVTRSMAATFHEFPPE